MTETDVLATLDSVPDWLELSAGDPRLADVTATLSDVKKADKATVRRAGLRYLRDGDRSPESYLHRASVLLLLNRVYFAVPKNDPRLSPLQETDSGLRIVGKWGILPAETYLWEIEFEDFDGTFGLRK